MKCWMWCVWPRGKSLLKIAYVISVILKSNDFFLWFLVIFSDFFVWYFSNFSVICDFSAFSIWFYCDFVIFVCDFFVILREVYEKKSMICPSHLTMVVWVWPTKPLFLYGWHAVGMPLASPLQGFCFPLLLSKSSRRVWHIISNPGVSLRSAPGAMNIQKWELFLAHPVCNLPVLFNLCFDFGNLKFPFHSDWDRPYRCASHCLTITNFTVFCYLAIFRRKVNVIFSLNFLQHFFWLFFLNYNNHKWQYVNTLLLMMLFTFAGDVLLELYFPEGL